MKFIDETNEAYHARTEVSASMLKKLDERPRLFEAYYVTREVPSEPSDAMRFGTMLHTAILEPEEFESRYIVCPAECSDRRTKAYKEWAATVGDREIVTEQDRSRLLRSADAVRNNADAKAILDAAQIKEKSIYFTDFLSDVPCRVRFDALAGSLIVDIKSINECTEDNFRYQVEKYRYDLQAAHYLEGFKSLAPGVHWRFAFIAVETTFPFCCRVFDIETEDIENAMARRARLLDDYKARQQSGDWSDPNEFKITTVSLSRRTKEKAFAV
jgi:exodeoxyribonuclease VIII